MLSDQQHFVKALGCSSAPFLPSFRAKLSWESGWDQMLAKQSLAELLLRASSFGSAISLRFGKELLSLITIHAGTCGSSWEFLLHWGLGFSKVGLLP